MDTVRIIQRFNHLFYAPQFVAMHLGVFGDEGLRVELTTATSAADLNDQLLGGGADIGLGGPMRTLELAEQNAPGRLISVIEVTSRSGFFLLGREPRAQFEWGDLVGRRLILFAEAPTPWLCLQYVLRRHAIDPVAVLVRRNVPTSEAVAAFLRGDVDYLEQAQPVTETLVSAGQAAVVASEGDAVGVLPFSAYLTTAALAARRPDLLRRFTRAFYRAQQWLAQHSAADISALIAPSFGEIAPALRTRIIDRYLGQQTWARDPLVREQGFEHLQDILLGAGFTSRRYEYGDHVNVAFAHHAMA
jgi:NitT/TauT family transport system substrate-binding protein